MIVVALNSYNIHKHRLEHLNTYLAPEVILDIWYDYIHIKYMQQCNNKFFCLKSKMNVLVYLSYIYPIVMKQKGQPEMGFVRIILMRMLIVEVRFHYETFPK